MVPTLPFDSSLVNSFWVSKQHNNVRYDLFYSFNLLTFLFLNLFLFHVPLYFSQEY